MRNCLILLLLAGLSPTFGQSLSAEKIIDRSIAYHDPDGQWSSLNAVLYFEEAQPDGEVRKTMAWIDNSIGFFKLDRGGVEVHGMKMDSCFVITGDVDCSRAERMRNYYIYLWGLPMKLKDSQASVQSAGLADWEDIECHMVEVHYETDQWKFYFDKVSFRLTGYEFVQNNGNGERILLEGEAMIGSIKVPASRSWYVTSDNRFLGTDHLAMAIER